MFHEWAHDWVWSSSSPVTAALMMILFWLLGFLPSIIAFLRKHHSSVAILALNILLGWTGLGWIIAFIWSLSWPGHERVSCAPFHHENPV
ncbi:MAG: superinfection immunity protein [Chlorobiaceae bacterium]|nr:superinfection immunity protein [Chlorobiaceae bacterium]NTV26928.1 superinfection immunity protein [Chlorobiaceae bacterium]